MTREEIIRLIIQCGMWSNDSGYYEGHIENIEEAMQEYAESENAALRQQVKDMGEVIKELKERFEAWGYNVTIPRKS